MFPLDDFWLSPLTISTSPPTFSSADAAPPEIVTGLPAVTPLLPGLRMILPDCPAPAAPLAIEITPLLSETVLPVAISSLPLPFVPETALLAEASRTFPLKDALPAPLVIVTSPPVF